MSIADVVLEIDVRAFGARRREPAGYKVNRPTGFHETIWVRFHDAMRLQVSGVDYESKPGSIIVIPAGQPHWYTSITGSWCNDWMHIAGGSMERICQSVGHTIGSPFIPNETSYVSLHFEMIGRDLARKDGLGKSLASLAILSLITRTVAACNMPDVTYSVAESAHRIVFDRLRQRVHAHLDLQWDIPSLANSVHLGVSRFSELYLRFYGVSAIEDLLQGRIRSAEQLLSNAALTINEVATRTGFSSHAYFSRIFRSRVGMSPMEYRRRELLS